MNTAETYREQERSFRIAELIGIPRNERTEHALFPGHQQDQIFVSWEGERAILATPLWAQASWDLRLALLQTALAAFDCIEGAPNARLEWSFSSKVVDRADAARILSEWMDVGGPPVMDLFDFVGVANGHGQRLSSRGLAVIFGHEIEAQIEGPTDQNLATMVAHLAQDLLCNGPLNTEEATGPDGQAYCLTQVDKNSDAEKMLRITRR